MRSLAVLFGVSTILVACGSADDPSPSPAPEPQVGTIQEEQTCIKGLTCNGGGGGGSGGGGGCTPTTCAAQGKTCGTISNGCGGTLQCGTCSAGYVCTTSNVCVVCTSTLCR